MTVMLMIIAILNVGLRVNVDSHLFNSDLITIYTIYLGCNKCVCVGVTERVGV